MGDNFQGRNTKRTRNDDCTKLNEILAPLISPLIFAIHLYLQKEWYWRFTSPPYGHYNNLENGIAEEKGCLLNDRDARDKLLCCKCNNRQHCKPTMLNFTQFHVESRSLVLLLSGQLLCDDFDAKLRSECMQSQGIEAEVAWNVTYFL